MPVTARFEDRTLRLISTGDYGWTDVHAAIRHAMTADPFERGRTVLVFDSSMSQATRSSDELRDIAGDLARLAPDLGGIVIVAPDDLHFGLARMLAAYAEPLGAFILVFRSMEAADTWIRADGARGGGG